MRATAAALAVGVAPADDERGAVDDKIGVSAAAAAALYGAGYKGGWSKKNRPPMPPWPPPPPVPPLAPPDTRPSSVSLSVTRPELSRFSSFGWFLAIFASLAGLTRPPADEHLPCRPKVGLGRAYSRRAPARLGQQSLSKSLVLIVWRHGLLG